MCNHGARQQQRHPSAHRGADQYLLAIAAGLDYGVSFLEPRADGAVLEVAAGFAMPRIIETDAGAAVVLRIGIKLTRLGAQHVRLESTEPDEAGPAPLAAAYRDAALTVR